MNGGGQVSRGRHVGGKSVDLGMGRRQRIPRPGGQLSLKQEHSRTSVRKVGWEGVDSASDD